MKDPERKQIISLEEAKEYQQKKAAADWPEPLPLNPAAEAEGYPVDALPPGVCGAMEEIQQFVKAPTPLVAASALASLSLAIQGLADIQRDSELVGPTGLFLLTIGDSGERKSQCDKMFTQPIKAYQAEREQAAIPEINEYLALTGAWEAERQGVKDKLRRLAKEGKDTAAQRQILVTLEQEKPLPPKVPHLFYSDFTSESLRYGVSKDWPSAGIISSEGGIVFGNRAMSAESIMRNLATINVLWDGGQEQTKRRTSESFKLHGGRLTVSIQVQASVLKRFYDQNGTLARGSGFMARFLFSNPPSTQGTRFYTEPPKHWPKRSQFNERIQDILDDPLAIDEHGSLNPAKLSLTPAAKRLWVQFHDGIEAELKSDGELFDIKDVASKAADNAARLAALFHVFEHGLNAVSAEAFESASRIVAWHLLEARRFFGTLSTPSELTNAGKLEAFIMNYCRKNNVAAVSSRELRRLGPHAIREKKAFLAAITELIDLDRVRLVKEGSKALIEIHPALLRGEA